MYRINKSGFTTRFIIEFVMPVVFIAAILFAATYKKYEQTAAALKTVTPVILPAPMVSASPSKKKLEDFYP